MGCYKDAPYYSKNLLMIPVLFSIVQLYLNCKCNTMSKNRMEAFSDGVLAIIITIMVLGIALPETYDWTGLKKILPVLFGYFLSFIFIGIYWNNHHHLLHTVKRVTPAIMWSNLNLLFWLSLIPFATAWMGKSNYETFTVFIYAILLVLCGVAYDILRRSIVKSYTEQNALITALLKQKKKALISTICYMAAVPVAYIHVGISIFLFLLVSVLWIIPDKNIEKPLSD